MSHMWFGTWPKQQQIVVNLYRYFFYHTYRLRRTVKMLTSPKRRALLECCPFFYPFGNTPAHNVLQVFDGLEPAHDDGTGLNV